MTRAAVSTGRSALYVGGVVHQRLRPLRHRLAYRVFSLLIDLDELPALDARLRCFSVGRFNLFSFHPADHAEGGAADVAALRGQIDGRLRAAGLPTGGAVRLLTMPRILGYAFNPLSLWFCDAPQGGLQAIVYEVNNTFGDRHSYVIPVDEAPDAAVIQQRSDKRLFVSPFLGMDLHYRFRIEPPREGVAVTVDVHDGEGRDGMVLHARLQAQRQPLTDAGLLKAFATHPLLTLKVIGAIHWEALKLWRKGARLHRRAAAPTRPFTVVRPDDPT